jgi:hypothetical protein
VIAGGMAVIFWEAGELGLTACRESSNCWRNAAFCSRNPAFCSCS